VDILARLGGDEFVVMLVDCAAPDLPLYRLSQRVNEYNEKAKGPFRIAFSTGAATFDPTNPQELEELIKRADSAMYEQKRSKRRT
jgi:diguanylate cyclase (GGDEF)-like protein